MPSIRFSYNPQLDFHWTDQNANLIFTFITDLHFAYKAPGSRQGDYFVDLSDQFRQVANYTTTVGGQLLSGGDVFHYKKVERNPTFFLTNMVELFSITNLPVVGIPGNHDLEHDLLSSLPKQPLGNLIAAGAYHNLCPLEYTDPKSSYASHNPTAFPFPTKLRPTLWINQNTVVFAIGLPYVEHAPLLKDYLSSQTFHDAMEDMIARIRGAYPTQNIMGLMILHTLSGPYAGDFFGTVRCPYFEIHNALELSPAAATIQAILIGHEHAEDKPVAYPIVASGKLRLFLNPSSFSVASLDYDVNKENPDRPVYALTMQAMPADHSDPSLAGNFATGQLPIRTRPLKLLFGDKKGIHDVLNQDDESDSIVATPISGGQVDGKAIDWTGFNAALHNIGQLDKPEDFLIQRLKAEPHEVQAAVSELLQRMKQENP